MKNGNPQKIFPMRMVVKGEVDGEKNVYIHQNGIRLVHTKKTPKRQAISI